VSSMTTPQMKALVDNPTPIQLQLRLELSTECQAFRAGYLAGLRDHRTRFDDGYALNTAMRKYFEAPQEKCDA